MTLKATIDFETRSMADLKSIGAYKYAIDPSTLILCLAYRLPGERIELWAPSLGPFPRLLSEHVEKGGIVEAHNAGFEYAVWNYCLRRLHRNIPVLRLSQLECSAAKAAALSLPRALENAAKAMRLPLEKDMTGNRVMLKMSKPRKPTKNNPAIWHDDEADYETLYAYCKKDVEVEEALSDSIPALSDYEKDIWRFSEHINERGIYCDVPSIKTAIRFLDRYQAEMLLKFKRLTGGKVETVKQVEKLKAFLLEDCGVDVPNLAADTVSEFLAREDLSKKARAVLKIRQLLSKSSVTKYTSMLNVAGPDNRLRGTLLYHGASTGRYTGRLIQPQNYVKSKIKDVDSVFALLEMGDYEFFKAVFPDVFTALASALRGMLCAAPGKELIAGDFSAIEARVLLWLARDEKNLKLWREGKDAYRYMASDIYGVSPDDVSAAQRDMGKRAVLGCLAENSPVLTPRGFKNIQDITKEDELWDGKNWVKHGGVLAKGLKTVIASPKLAFDSTWDHWILSENVWYCAAEIALAEDTPSQKRETVTAPSLWSKVNLKEAPNAVSLSAAYAELKKNFESINSGPGSIVYAFLVSSLCADKNEEERREIVTSYLITDLENVGRLASIILKSDACLPVQKTSRGMAVAEFGSNLNPLENFWNTLLRCAGLINGASPWTELITTDTMRPETLESLLKKKTIKTEQKETFDILNSGPENRFQVAGSIVHNCGYSMGAHKFKETCFNQGRVVISEDFAKKVIDAYRSRHSAVVALWKDTEAAAKNAIRNPGKVYTVGYISFKVAKNFLWIKLPSGRKLAYPEPCLRETMTKWGPREEIRFMAAHPVSKKWLSEATYGGKLVENITQAVARDVMVSAMCRLRDNKYFPVMTVHDEIICEIDEGFGEIHIFEKYMSKAPDWAPGLPLAVSAWKGKRYKK